MLNINTNGGTLNVYGNSNSLQSVAGSSTPLTINDSAGTGIVNLYGGQSSSAGGNDYSGTSVTVAAGTLNLLLDSGNQSISDINATGGSITGTAYTGDVTMSGASQMTATNIVMNSLTLSGSSAVFGSVQISNDLNLTKAASFSPSASSVAFVGGNLIASSGSPAMVVSFDGTNVSEIAAGSASVSNLQVDLLFAAGTYSPGTQTLTIVTGALVVPPQPPLSGILVESF